MTKDYFKLGINHHLIYPGVLEDKDFHLKTLVEILNMDEYEIIDLSLPEDDPIRKKEIELLRQSGKDIIYNCPLFFLNDNRYEPNSDDPHIMENTLEIMKRYIYFAAEAGAKKVLYASGRDQGPENRKKLINNFIKYSYNLCKLAAEYGIQMIIEPFDRSVGKNLLIGPTIEALFVVENIKSMGMKNIGLMVDMGHIPIMKESFDEAIRLSGPHLIHIHIGNCVIRNPASVYYGDTHPPIGIDGGENDMPELVRFLSVLIEQGYIKKSQKNSITIEMQPYPGVSPVLSAKVAYEKVVNAFMYALKNQSPKIFDGLTVNNFLNNITQ